MIKLLILFLFMPVLSSAQKPLPRFENDTLYTTSGFRIYKGQTLQFGIGIRKRGAFKYINIKTDHSSSSLAGNNFIVNRLTNFGVSQLNNSYIEIKASITFRDGSKGGIDIHIAIDSAINSSELIVPEEDQFSTDSLIVSAQKNLPRFQNDTLFTTSGFKIFDGQVLQLGNASGKKGKL